MPNLAYAYVPRGNVAGPPGPATCLAGGAAGGLIGVANPAGPTWPQLYNAQFVIGVYPVGWANIEMIWRAASLRIGSVPAGNMTPSPVVNQADLTEKGQISYHVGTAAGLYLAMNFLHAAAPARYFPFLLSRALQLGATVTLQGGANGSRPDLLLISLTLPVAPGGNANFNNFIAWECKGHGYNMGQAPLGPALIQSAQVTNMTALPGNVALPATAPVAIVASQIDVFHNDYRMQTVDPDNPDITGHTIKGGGSDDFLKAFYSPFIEVIDTKSERRREVIDNVPVYVHEILPHIFFGLDARIYHAFTKPVEHLSSEVGSILSAGYTNSSPNGYWFNALGICAVLETGWDLSPAP